MSPYKHIDNKSGAGRHLKEQKHSKALEKYGSTLNIFIYRSSVEQPLWLRDTERRIYCRGRHCFY